MTVLVTSNFKTKNTSLLEVLNFFFSTLKEEIRSWGSQNTNINIKTSNIVGFK